MQSGKAKVVLYRREASLLKAVIETDVKVGINARKPGWRYQCLAKCLMASGMVKVFFLSLYSQRANKLFDFYIFNRKKIRNIDEKKNDNSITFVFHKKSDQKILDQDLVRYRKAAAQGDVDAQTYLGFIHLKGKGIPVDIKEAREWFSKAAQHGDPKAQTYLAHIYEKGQGIPRDMGEAIKWYRQAAEQGYALAQYNLGVLYENGEGVDKNETEAASWYRRAAEGGEAVAQFTLAKMYAGGHGVEMNDMEARSWLHRAAEQGNVDAQRFLSLAYQDGLCGCVRDPIKAKHWLDRSKEHNESP